MPNAKERGVWFLATFLIIVISFISYSKFFSNTELQTQSGEITIGTSPPESMIPKNKTSVHDQRLNAQNDLENLLLNIKTLKPLNPQVWAVDRWKEIEQFLREGEALYRTTRYHLAQKKYRQATIMVRDLASRVESVKLDNLREGDLAIKNWNSVKAERAFQIVLSIEPNNPDGLNGLKRSKVLEEVKILLSQGEKYEKANQLDKAKKFYESALLLDKNALGAKVAIVRINFKLRPTYYRSYMSSGLKLVRQNRLEEAEIFVRKAQAIENRAETLELLSLIDSKRLTNNINRHLKVASAAEKEEKWDLAVKSFNSAIRLDPAMNSIIKKKKKAEARALLDQNIEAILTEKNDLASRADFEIAKSLLKQARLSVPRNKHIRAQIKKLEKRLETSRMSTETSRVYAKEKKPN